MAPKDKNFFEMSLEELQDVAQKHDIKGRSKMNKDELLAVLTDPATVTPTTTEVPRGEYERVVAENRVLRAQIQQTAQGAVGAPQPGAPSPGEESV